MSRFSWLCGALAWVSSLCCVPAVHAPIKEMKSASVALVYHNTDEDEWRVFCSGTLVEYKGHTDILTAAHCVDGIEDEGNMSDDDVSIHFVVPGDDPGDIHGEPYGMHLTTLDKKDADLDLALLRVLAPSTFEHSVAPIAKQRPEVGDRLSVVSSPKGQYFLLGESYMVGMRREVEEKDGEFIEIAQTGMWFGSSGSGVMNMSGEVIGVTSMIPSMPSNLLLVDTDSIRRFVSDK